MKSQLVERNPLPSPLAGKTPSDLLQRLEKEGWVLKRLLPMRDLYKLGQAQDYWERRGYETRVFNERDGTVRPLLPTIKALMVRKIPGAA